MTAREEEWAEGTKLSLAQVASVYQVNPTMVGLLDNANFSNVEAFRKMLYADTLGPIIKWVEDMVNTFVVPMIGCEPGTYCEFNVAGKLKGSFEEQARSLQTSVGAPWLTRNEARARENLPAIEGGDQLVTPLNVLVGDQASPTDSGTQNLRARVAGIKSVDGRIQVKSQPSQTVVDGLTETLQQFFTRQSAAVGSRLGSKTVGDWWDETRWDTELAEDLYSLAVQAATQVGMDTALKLGFQPDDYDEARTLAFLWAVTKTRARWINQATRRQIEQALADGADVEDVFKTALNQRCGAAGWALAAMLTAWAVLEAAHQLAGGRTMWKTWVTGHNPRPEHAAMDGETVPRTDVFSNGATWPGDPILGPEGVSNCNCGIILEWSNREH